MIEENGERYSYEEYAAMWGADPVYCHLPQKPYDGYMFYNFGSEKQERTKVWLIQFKGAIERLVSAIESNNFGTAMGSEGEDQSKIDIANLGLLKAHVEKLLLEQECNLDNLSKLGKTVLKLKT